MLWEVKVGHLGLCHQELAGATEELLTGVCRVGVPRTPVAGGNAGGVGGV